MYLSFLLFKRLKALLKKGDPQVVVEEVEVVKAADHPPVEVEVVVEMEVVKAADPPPVEVEVVVEVKEVETVDPLLVGSRPIEVEAQGKILGKRQ